MRLEKLTGSGKFIHPIVIQQNEGGTVDANGKPIPNWQTFSEDFARVTYLSGDDAIVIHARRPTASHTVEMRERPGITEKMRVKYRERLLYIEEVGDPNDGEIQLLCHEAK